MRRFSHELADRARRCRQDRADHHPRLDRRHDWPGPRHLARRSPRAAHVRPQGGVRYVHVASRLAGGDRRHGQRSRHRQHARARLLGGDQLGASCQRGCGTCADAAAQLKFAGAKAFDRVRQYGINLYDHQDQAETAHLFDPSLPYDHFEAGMAWNEDIQQQIENIAIAQILKIEPGQHANRYVASILLRRDERVRMLAQAGPVTAAEASS